MKSLICLVAAMLLAQSLPAQSDFEGVLEFSTYTLQADENSEVKWFIKDNNSRLEISGTAKGMPHQSTLIFRKNDPNIYLLTKIGGENAVYTIHQSSITQTSKPKGTVTKQEAKTKSIAGYNCYFVKIESPDEVTECWVTDEIKLSAENFPPALRSLGIMGALKDNGISGLTLDVTSKNAAGETSFYYKVARISKKELDSSLFALPAGYGDGEDLLKKSIKAE